MLTTYVSGIYRIIRLNFDKFSQKEGSKFQTIGRIGLHENVEFNLHLIYSNNYLLASVEFTC